MYLSYFIIQVLKCVKSCSCVQNPYAELHHLEGGGAKSAVLTFYLTPQTVANIKQTRL